MEKVAELEGHTERVWHAAWNPSGTALATCGGDRSVRIWQKEGDKWVQKTLLENVHEKTVRCVCWSPCGKFLASASFDSQVGVWKNVDNEFECIATLEGPENEVKCVDWSMSGSLIATCSRDKTVWIWECVANQTEFECLSVLHGHSQDVKSVAWHPNSDMLLSCSYDDTIKVWKEDEDDWYCASTVDPHESTVWGCSFDPSGKWFTSVSDDKSIRFHHNVDGEWKTKVTLSGSHRRCVYSVDWSKDTDSTECGGRIATGCGDNAIRIFAKALSGETSFDMLHVEDGAHSGDVNCVKWNPTEHDLLASCGDDNIVRLWKVTAKAE